MGKILQPDDDELLLALLFTKVVDTFSIVADAEHLVVGNWGNTQNSVLQTSISHHSATCGPDADAAIIVCFKLVVVLPDHFKWARSKLSWRVAKHIACVLTVLTCIFCRRHFGAIARIWGILLVLLLFVRY